MGQRDRLAMTIVQERYDKTHARAMARLIERKGKIKNVGGKRACLNFTITSL